MGKTVQSYKSSFILLCLFALAVSGVSAQSNFEWIRARGVEIPNRAVEGGAEPDGQKTFVCRTGERESSLSGKLLNNRCYYNDGRRERSSDRFEVLVGDKYSWDSHNINYDRAVIGGSNRDENFYVCRVLQSGGRFPGFVEDGRCYYTAAGRGSTSRSFEVLQGVELTYTLLTAAEKGDDRAVRDALRDGQAINQKDSAGQTALIIASRRGFAGIVRDLLYERASVDLRDNSGNTALMHAALEGKDEIVRLLIREGANANTRNNNGDSAFILAAERGHSGIVSDLLGSGDFDRIDRRDLETAFRGAAINGHLDVLRVLLDENIDIESRDLEGRTALMLAASNDRSDIVKFLLRSNAEINARDLGENSAFDLAVLADAENALRVLAVDGNFTRDDKQMEIGILKAARYDKRDALKFLIGFGVAADTRDGSTGNTPLMLAASEGHDEAAEMLIRAAAGLNLQNDLGETAVMLAAAKSKNNTLKELIKAGADINLRDNAGRTALSLAILNKHKDTRKTLQKAGAKQ